MTRANFEFLWETLDGATETQDIWSVATILDRCKRYIAGLPKLCKGRLSTKITAGVLWSAKQDLYWWCIRFTDGFGPLYLQWHEGMNAQIHQIAVHDGKSFKHLLPTARP